MERTVPIRSSEEIDLYLRTIYSLLRATTEVQIKSFEEIHTNMNSSLHVNANQNDPDISAFIYSLLRLPDCIQSVKTIVLGQNAAVFHQSGLEEIDRWNEVTAKARRRRCLFDGTERLACFIASRSDIDDIIPTLTALQIEWNKIHNLLQTIPHDLIPTTISESKEVIKKFSSQIKIEIEDLNRLRTVFGNNFYQLINNIKNKQLNFRVRLLGGSLNDYRRATQTWWNNILRAFPSINKRPVYFISSNTHSVVNILSGFALSKKEQVINYIESTKDYDLKAEWESIKQLKVPSSPENFLYYVNKKMQSNESGLELLEEQSSYEKASGITRIPSEHAFDIEAQIIDLSKLNIVSIDPRISPCPCESREEEWEFLRKSQAIIFNIDYPLGLAAYNLLAKLAENVTNIKGIYIMGKAASLNGVRGDVIVPNVVHDEQSKNTYIFNNAFSASDISPYLVYGTVLDNQKAVSVMGTFLQNAKIMDVIYREGFTDIEMEAGPYLSAIYEMSRPKRHPSNEIVALQGLPFDLGILHYVSDTPLTKGKNLGAGTLSYFGIDSTYACSLAILRKIMQNEKEKS